MLYISHTPPDSPFTIKHWSNFYKGSLELLHKSFRQQIDVLKELIELDPIQPQHSLTHAASIKAQFGTIT